MVSHGDFRCNPAREIMLSNRQVNYEEKESLRLEQDDINLYVNENGAK